MKSFLQSLHNLPPQRQQSHQQNIANHKPNQENINPRVPAHPEVIPLGVHGLAAGHSDGEEGEGHQDAANPRRPPEVCVDLQGPLVGPVGGDAARDGEHLVAEVGEDQHEQARDQQGEGRADRLGPPQGRALSPQGLDLPWAAIEGILHEVGPSFLVLVLHIVRVQREGLGGLLIDPLPPLIPPLKEPPPMLPQHPLQPARIHLTTICL
eukprot:TRINITY_DN26258_c0_g1_i2.p1 TRINITY_DN26258_c0_g1~~TRINITY_DN26258_c0_g1_i2.p1  ORF type:complete len:209 (+),score=17.66 TRINITY_DN26258_c0_g1_i2:45-671(+)